MKPRLLLRDFMSLGVPGRVVLSGTTIQNLSFTALTRLRLGRRTSFGSRKHTRQVFQQTIKDSRVRTCTLLVGLCKRRYPELLVVSLPSSYLPLFKYSTY